MPEVELELLCENCGSQCRIIYDTDLVHYAPENCPFCGEVVVDEEADDEDEDEEGLWGDDGLSDSDDNNWN